MKENLYEEAKDKEEESIDLRALIFQYIIHWPWFVISVIACIAAAWLYLHFATPIYDINASVIIKDENKNNKAPSSSMMGLEDLGFFSSSNNFDNGIEVLKSRTLVRKVVENLNLYINYQVSDGMKKKELYNESPVIVWLNPEEAVNLPNGNAAFDLTVTPDKKVSVKAIINDETFTKEINKLPSILATPYGTFNISASDKINTLKEKEEIKVNVTSPFIIANGYESALTVEPTSKTTTIASITLKSSNKQKGKDFINKLVELYNKDTNDDKNEVATRTAEFIEERIGIINGELGNTEQQLENFKRKAGLTDLKSDAQLALQQSSEYEKKCVENATQIHMVQYLSEYANNPANSGEVLPVNVGLTDNDLSTIIDNYNQMVLERKRLLRTSSESNPAVINIDSSLKSMRASVLTTIESVLKGLFITHNNLEREAGKFKGKITEAPGQEREFVSISRQQEIKAGLYLMLLQKREENAISLASVANNARIVDEALSSTVPVSPKKNIIYLLALVLGIAIPVGIIYVLNILKYKIEERDDVEKITRVPIVGDVPLSKRKANGNAIAVHENQNDMMAEIFRNIRTNVLYMLGKNAKVILITSSNTGEGKSFISANLAVSLALLGKKVVIVGLDVRKPGLNKAFALTKHGEGITSYLSNPDDTDLMSLVQQCSFNKNLSILVSGIIPPNPTELVSRDSLDKAIDTLKEHYDYIVLDTAPIGLVTDTQIIGRVANLSIYVCRADYTTKAEYQLVNYLHDNNKLPNMCTIINGIDTENKKYGYSYGYGKYGKYGHAYGYAKGYGYGYGQGYGEHHDEAKKNK